MKSISIVYSALAALLLVASQSNLFVAAQNQVAPANTKFLRANESSALPVTNGQGNHRELQSFFSLLFNFLSNIGADLSGFIAVLQAILGVPISVTPPTTTVAPTTSTTTTTSAPATTTAAATTAAATTAEATTAAATTAEATTAAATTAAATTAAATTAAAPVSVIQKIQTLSSANGDKFSIALAFVQASSSFAELSDINDGPFTVLVPSNSLFTSVFSTLSSLAGGTSTVNETCLQNASSVLDLLVSFYIIDGTSLELGDFTAGSLTTKSGQDVRVSLQQSFVFLSGNPAVPSSATVLDLADNDADNGIVLELDGILAPILDDAAVLALQQACATAN